MARFIGTLKGKARPGSKLGTEQSGLIAEVNGWKVGCRVEARVSQGMDTFRIFATTGSDPEKRERLIAEYISVDSEEIPE